MKKRLQKIMAEAGIASRRKCEEFIANGRVMVNGKIVTEQGLKVDPEADEIFFDNKLVAKKEEKIYLKINKPKGYVCTSKDIHAKKKVISLIKNIPERLYTVGRLDKDAEGLLILTNDGELTKQITHPKHKIGKTYIVEAEGYLSKEAIEKLEKGLMLEDGLTQPCEVNIINRRKVKTTVKITIHEGRKRQIKRMFKAISSNVLSLKRISIGSLKLGDLRPGEYKPIPYSKITSLYFNNK